MTSKSLEFQLSKKHLIKDISFYFRIMNNFTDYEGIYKVKTNLAVGFDNGNLHARVATEDSKKMDESYVLEIDNEGDGIDYFYCLRDNTSNWEGKKFIIGSKALKINSKKGVRVMDDDLHKAELALPLLVALVWDSIEEKGTNIQLGISCPNVDSLEPLINQHLNGKFRFAYKGVIKSFQIEVIKTYVEGQGVIKVQRDISRGLCLFDMGSDTLIVSQFEGYNRVNSIPLAGSGVRTLIESITCSPEIRSPNLLSRSPGFNEVLQMFEKSKDNKYFLNDVEVTEIVNKLAIEWVTLGLRESKRVLKSAFNSGTLLASGGGCKIQVVRDYLTQNNFKIAGDPIWDNAKGLLKFVLGKQNKATNIVRIKNNEESTVSKVEVSTNA